MSYILEALKMSELARRQSTADAPISLLPPAVVEEPHARSTWPRTLLLAGLIAVAVAVVVVAWWQLFVSPVPAAGELPKAVVAVPVIPATGEMPAPSSAQATRPTPNVSAPVAAVAIPHQPPPKTVTTTAAKRLAAATAASPPIAKAKPTEKPATTDGLPASVRQQLPPLVLSGRVLDGNTRLVIVDGKVIGEGEEVAPGLTVDKITDDDVVFAFKGRRFRR
jgi:general secretion pathway protein B